MRLFLDVQKFQTPNNQAYAGTSLLYFAFWPPNSPQRSGPTTNQNKLWKLSSLLLDDIRRNHHLAQAVGIQAVDW